MKLRFISYLLLWQSALTVTVSVSANEPEGSCIIDTDTGTCQTTTTDPIAERKASRNDTRQRIAAQKTARGNAEQIDANEDCGDWAESGECEVNPR